MARELTLEIVANTTQADQALKGTEAALKDVATAAEGADKKLSLIDQHAPELGQKLRGLQQDAAKLKTEIDQQAKAADTAARSTSTLTEMVTRFAGPAVIVAAAKRSIDLADSIKELSQQSGFSTDAIQTLGHVAVRAGSSFAAVANAANQLDRNLVKGGDSVTRIIGELGFRIDDLLAMQPEERFRELGAAIGGVTDPAKRAEMAMSLFGRQGRDLLPMFQDLAAGAEANAPRMANAFVEAGAEISDVIDDVLAGLKTLMAQFFLLPSVISNWAGSWGQTVGEALGLRGVTGVPTAPGRPTLGFAPGFGGIDPLNGQSMGFVERQLTQSAQEQIRQRTGGGTGRILPFVRPDLMGELQGYPLAQAQMYNGVGFPGMTGGFMGPSFPGWAPLAPLAATPFGFTGAGFAPTVPMNAPGAGSWISRFMQSSGGRIAGMGLGMLSGLLPGMSGFGSSIGSTAGSVIGSIGSLAGSTLGSLLGPLGGLAGGLIGKLFGPSEGVKTNRTRDAAIAQDFGSVDALREAAERAGFSVDKLLSVKKVKDFQSEYEKLKKAIADTDQDAARVSEAMDRWGLTIQDMGPKFQQSQINTAFKDALDDIRVLTNAGADFNTIAEKMAPTLGGMVQEAIEMGGTVPREMEPILKKMIELGLLTDKNGDKFTELSQVPFAQDLNKDFTTLIGKMDALITKISQLPGLLDDATQSANQLANAMPGDPGTGGGSGDGAAGFDSGGMAGRSWRRPSMRDTIPAMLRPGELVLTPEQQRGGVAIGSLVINTSTQNRAQFVRDVGEAIVSYYERRGRRVA